MIKEKDELMLTQDQLVKAIEEEIHVKKHYPNHWLLFKMISEMNVGLSAMVELLEKDKKLKENKND